MTLHIISLLAALAVFSQITPAVTADMVYGIHAETGELYRVSTSDASVSLVGNTGVSGMGALEFAPNGALVGFTTGPHPMFYAIDPNTAQATPIRPLNFGIDVFEGGLAFSNDGRIFATNGGTVNNPLLLGIDPNGSNDFVIGTINGGALHDIGGLGWRDDVLIGLDRVSLALLQIDPATGNTTILQELNQGIVAGVIGGIALQATDLGASAVEGYFSTATDTGTSSLYRFDPYTGDHTLIGEFDPDVITGAGFGGLAIIPEPASVVLLLAGSMMIAFRRR